MNSQSTTYSVLDDPNDGVRTTISIDKHDADVLQLHLPDVHAYIQSIFFRIKERYPKLSRRKQGDMVRRIAGKKAVTYPEHDWHDVGRWAELGILKL